MSLIDLKSISQLDEIDAKSKTNIIIIFKHSTRCSISDIALSRIQKSTATLPRDAIMYYLDIIRFRDISDEIAQKYHVYHESPQVLLISECECFFDCSHLDIAWPLILDQIERATLVS